MNQVKEKILHKIELIQADIEDYIRKEWIPCDNEDWEDMIYNLEEITRLVHTL